MRLRTRAKNCLSRSDADQSTLDRIRQLRCVGTATLEAIGFWIAVVLPLPTFLLLIFGSGTPTELVAVAGLLAANLLAFILGHEYSRVAPAQ